MTFEQWVDKERGNDSVNSVLERIAETSKVSRATLYNLYKGMRLSSYSKAVAISRATRSKVKAKDMVKA